MKLNRGQDEAIKHGNGPCMVLAPPGSGKTLIVTERTRYLIEESGVRPDQILVITFTRYAAREMKERFERLTAGKNYPVTFGTFHSIFYGILKCAYGIGANNLMSEKESSVLLQEVLDQTDIESTPEVEDEEELVRELLREVGMVKNGLCHLKDFHSKYLTQDEFAEVFRSYEHQKKELKKFDFDDMLVQCYALFRKKPEILQGWQKRFQYILIDEFQDINRVQYEVIRMLAAPRYNLFVVGDDDQSIYGFRGAKPELMLYMKQEFPSLRTISLTVNYRSTEFITGAAARVILHNDTRFYKRVQSFRGRGQNVHVQEVLDEQEEAQYVTEEIQKKLDQVDLGEGEGASSYAKHYLMIAGAENTLMWDSIYESASQAAKDADAYLELIEPGHDSNYSQADYLRIGIASQVDGIILEADGSDEEQELIQEASDADIPVVTVLTDDSSSARISFVGLNSYQLGNAYTEQILGLLKEHENTQVLLLSNSQSKTQETNLIYYQIKKELEEKKKDYQTVTISEYNIDSSSGFDTEEFVRDIFVSEENLPDVLVCMDEVVTECVYQALVDYNQVGNVDVVGFYYSDVILDGISKGIISSAIALDMDEIGRYSVNALEEFSSLGHTSNYYSVGQHVITRSNVGAYRTEGN